MALMVMIYHRVAFDDGDITTLPQIFLFVHSFIFIIFIVSAPICILRFLAPRTLKGGIYEVYFTRQLMRMPYYVRKVRKKYLADDNVDFEIDLPI
jgi:hypothetical protein